MTIPYRNPWFISAAVLIVASLGWWWYHAKTSTKAPTAATTSVTKGTLVQSVSGSGTLVAKIEADISAPTYGTVQSLLVKNGDEVRANQPLFSLHSLATDADKAKALASLLSAQDSLQQAQTKTTSLAQAVTTDQQLLQDATKNEAITTTTVNSSQLAYDKSQVDAQKALKDAEKGIIDAASTQAKAATDLDVSAAQTGQASAGLSLDATKIGNKQTTTAAQATLQAAQRDAASAHLKTQSAQLAYQAAQATLQNQQTTIAAANASLTASRLSYQMLTDQTVTSPVAGRIVNLSLIPGAAVGSNSNNSSNSSTTSSTASGTKLFSIIDFNSLRAVVAVSEVDIPNVKLGQAATLTFDAIPDKTFTGTVTNMDTIGTTTSGVTTYNVEVSLDSLTDDIKPGMNVSASIITNRKDNVLLVPTTAIQTSNGQSTVQVVRNGATQTVNVTVGDSNDSETEITAGLQAGDEVVTNPSATTSGNGSTSAFSGAGRGGFGAFGGGGAARRIGG